MRRRRYDITVHVADEHLREVGGRNIALDVDSRAKLDTAKIGRDVVEAFRSIVQMTNRAARAEKAAARARRKAESGELAGAIAILQSAHCSAATKDAIATLVAAVQRGKRL
jgi:hypothetical protein